jgi:hypothetical protein
MKPLICADCKWHLASKQSSTVANYDRCKASETINLVTGDATYKYCETMRIAGNSCDLDGKLFELNQVEEENPNGN